MPVSPKIKQMGERAFLLEFEQEINEGILQKVLFFKKIIQNKYIKEKVEVTNTYNSLLVIYHSTIEDSYRCYSELEELISEANIQPNFNSGVFKIPVCYDDQFGPDLAVISKAKALSKEEIIELHTAAEYLVYFIGFLPGFLYLGGLPEELHFPRRKEPRNRVLKGAVGIGEKQTGIYPQESPGGWNIIGNSPVPLFDPYSDPPCPFSAGDRIRFYSISIQEHREISEKVKSGEFHLNRMRDEG